MSPTEIGSFNNKLLILIIMIIKFTSTFFSFIDYLKMVRDLQIIYNSKESTFWSDKYLTTQSMWYKFKVEVICICRTRGPKQSNSLGICPLVSMPQVAGINPSTPL